ncbi:MAG: DUF4476 domain-containing protein [Bacteroidetes bacterium]|nr:DUF4476 domain-containing protein [Bacteroidota bacterium]
MRKTVLFILVLITISIAAQANHLLSSFAIRTNDNSLISISIDKGPFTNYSRKHLLTGIPAGYRQVTVYKIRPQHAPRLVFNQMVYVEQASEMSTVLRGFQNLQVVAVIPNTVVIDNGYYGYNGNGGGYNNQQVCASQCYMSDTQFEDLRRTVCNQNFDDTKLSIALAALRINKISSRQVAILMREFTFESNRLAFAKSAYQSTVDRENYFMVNNEFTFSSSINELNEYING